MDFQSVSGCLLVSDREYDILREIARVLNVHLEKVSSSLMRNVEYPQFVSQYLDFADDCNNTLFLFSD